jgi:hypothetical protein
MMFGKLKVKIKSIWNLIYHRNVISHPSTFQWTDPGTQKFYTANLHYLQNKAGEIWKTKKSIESNLSKLGDNSSNVLAIAVRIEFLDLFELIMRESLVPNVTLPNRVSIATSMQSFFSAYQAQLS